MKTLTKSLKVFALFAFALALVLALAGCGKQKVKLEISETEYTIEVGEELTVQTNLEEAQLAKVVWESSNPEVVSVAGGVLKGEAPGGAEVTVSFGKKQKITLHVAVFQAVIEATFPNAETKTLKINKGTAFTEPKAPAKEGWDFGGWFKDEACTESFDFTATYTANVEIYAKWVGAKVTYKIHENGGEEKAVIVEEVAKGSLARVPLDKFELPDKQAVDYRNCFEYKENGSVVKHWDFATDTVEKDTIIRIFITEIVKFQFVIVNPELNQPGGLSIPELTTLYNDESLLKQMQIAEILPNYRVKEFYKDEACTETLADQWHEIIVIDTVDPEICVDPENNVYRIYVLYEKATEVYFKENINNKILTVEHHFPGSKLTEPAAPTLEGHKFLSWADAEGSAIDWSAFEVTDNEVTIYAMFQKPVAVYFKENINKSILTVEHHFPGEKLTAPTAPKLPGEKFKGWTDTRGKAIDWNTFEVPSEDVIIYANYGHPSFHLVRENIPEGFESNYSGSGGSKYLFLADVKYGKKIPEPVFKATNPKDQRVITGWYRDPELTQPVDFTKKLTEEDYPNPEWIYLYPKVEKRCTVSIIVKTNEFVDIQCLAGETITMPFLGRLLNHDYEFWGYHETADFSDPRIVDGTKITVTENKVYFAHCKMKVVFVDYDGRIFSSLTQRHPVPFDDSDVFATEPTYPKESDVRVFNGWYRDPELTELYNFGSDVLTESINLYASVTRKLKITFDARPSQFDNGSDNRIYYFTLGETIEAPTPKSYSVSSGGVSVLMEFDKWKPIAGAPELPTVVEAGMLEQRYTYEATYK